MGEYFQKDAPTFCKFVELIRDLKPGWVFRGLSSSYELKTTLERALGKWGIGLENAPEIERKLIREFRRGYSGDRWNLVMDDTLYCLSVMQHHGAPTRLLDWTYSPYVAAKFAYDSTQANDRAVAWCLNTEWIEAEAKEIADATLLARWNDKRKDEDFVSLFQSSNHKSFIYTANPFHLNCRLKVQQGLFICQTNIACGFLNALGHLGGSKKKENIFSIVLPFEIAERTEFFDSLRRMNVSSASLYPGLDGYAQSLGERIYSYKN